MLNQPFCYELKIESSSIWRRKLSQSHIRGKKSIMLTILFVRNPSLEDDSDKLCKEIVLFMYPVSPEQTVASYRGRTKVKISRDTLISNLSYMRNTQEIHDANQYKGFINGSDKVNYSKIIKYTRDTLIGNRRNMRNTHFNITFYKKLASSCIWIIWNKPWRPIDDELKLKSLVIP